MIFDDIFQSILSNAVAHCSVYVSQTVKLRVEAHNNVNVGFVVSNTGAAAIDSTSILLTIIEPLATNIVILFAGFQFVIKEYVSVQIGSCNSLTSTNILFQFLIKKPALDVAQPFFVTDVNAVKGFSHPTKTSHDFLSIFVLDGNHFLSISNNNFLHVSSTSHHTRYDFSDLT
jgi:hypothetical protein